MNKTPEDLYLRIKNSNELISYSISDFKKIAYGIQFHIDSNIVRIYSSKKKGITLDTSQSKSDKLNLILNNIYDTFQGNSLSSSDFDTEKNQLYPIMDPPLLGSDEVGKGDFYAPIIVGSVYLEKNEYDILKTLGVRDRSEERRVGKECRL